MKKLAVFLMLQACLSLSITAHTEEPLVMEVRVDQHTYEPGDDLTIEIKIRNTSKQPVWVRNYFDPVFRKGHATIQFWVAPVETDSPTRTSAPTGIGIGAERSLTDFIKLLPGFFFGSTYTDNLSAFIIGEDGGPPPAGVYELNMQYFRSSTKQEEDWSIIP